MSDKSRPASSAASYAATWSASWAPGQYQSGVTPIDPATLDPYLYFRADPAAGGSITTVGGAVSSWSQVTTGGSNQITRTLGQTVANQQPQHDNTDKHITFDGTDDKLNLTLSGSIDDIAQAGIYFSATDRGVWVQEINGNALETINAIGPDRFSVMAGDVYSVVLLPNTLTDVQVEGVILWLLENTNAQKTTETNLTNYRRLQNSALRIFVSGIDTSSVTSFGATFMDNASLASFPVIDTSSGASFANTWRNCSSLTSFPVIDTSNATSFSVTWYNCSGLTSFPALNTSNVTSFHYTWYNNNSLADFPLLDSSSVTNFSNAFQNCSSLTSFPLLNTSSGTNFVETWRECTGLTSFPALDFSSATNLRGAWRGCTGLTSFPTMDLSSVTVFNLTWYGCNSLTSFPVIDVSSGTSFQYAWAVCGSLTSFPVLDTSNGTEFGLAWYQCNGLTSFPTININKGRNFAYAWQGCTALTSFPANFFDSWSPTSIADGVFDQCWSGCSSLTATSVENILVSLAASGKHATSTGASGGTAFTDPIIDIAYDASTGSLSSATTTAITTLKSRSWGVTINGVAQ